MAICESCGYDYDAQKRKCPQCSAPYKLMKSKLETAASQGDTFDITSTGTEEPGLPYNRVPGGAGTTNQAS